MNRTKLKGLIAATYTPFYANGDLNLDAIPAITDYLIDQGIRGLYVCGSTGEGVSMTLQERKAVAEKFVISSDRRVPVIVQVGHNSLSAAKELAQHAESIQADIISANCPSYFKISDLSTLVNFVRELAGSASQTPFYYYHIPALTGSQVDIVEFLLRAADTIPNLAGLKYTDTKLHEFQTCLEINGGQFDIVWGCDEMLLGALATGAEAAIGSTYNVAARLNQRLMAAFEANDLVTARLFQSHSIEMIRSFCEFPFHPTMKRFIESRGLTVGSCRLPHPALSEIQLQQLTEVFVRVESLLNVDAPGN